MKLLATTIIAAVAMFVSTNAQAASVSLVNSNLTGISDLNLTGTLLTAGNAVGGNINVGGIDFGAAGNVLGSGFGDSNPANAIGDANFDALLDTSSFGNTSFTFVGLIPGEDYHGQLFFSDNRGCCSTRTVTVNDGGANSVTTAAIGTPQLVDLSFTADATSQSLNISGSAVGYLAGFQLRADTDIVPNGTPIGNRIVSMLQASDGAQNVFYSNQVAMRGGIANSVEVFNQGVGGTFQMFQLRPTATAGEFEVIYDSGVMTTLGGPIGAMDILFPNGETSVMDGDIFAHFGRGIPFNIGSVLQEGDGGINRLLINFPADLSNVTIGNTITLDGNTGGLPVFNQAREYAWAVNVAVPEPTTALLGVLGMVGLGLRRRRLA